ncbi:HD domain-containing protein [Pediococcus inopinatus]|uniref:HD domain-containing protein n=1 Tax=Pediococcus inopinatus TaxID=114090 RepID=A0ABZ0Q542_9LACO|nr:HD domain-containing protein [Pediococcus inopinatus]AVL00389.1 hydrolase [Pediococcus inopinatus]KRN62879.1 HD superfamily hydrolase [Pediococcus inopinatus]WPC18048.1 HD domain-containing protein [Pediococcus inopinatus]WPC19601.1 HD domain-containing protein [Pediococcus inopinatus]WPC21300.1 HD domain-containing protein [Pediococcus inopinatus]
MGIHQYIQSLSNLETLVRAPGIFKYQKHSVAEHSFKVAQIAQFLGDVEENSGQTINWQSLYEKALNHDYNERFIGDIKTPVKYATPKLRAMLADVEDSLSESFVNTEIPSEFRAAYRRRLSEGKDSTLEGKILSVADKIDLLYESFGEIQKGNPELTYEEIYKESLTTIVKFQSMASVQYFLNEVLPDLLREKFTDQAKLEEITRHIIS